MLTFLVSFFPFFITCGAGVVEIVRAGELERVYFPKPVSVVLCVF